MAASRNRVRIIGGQWRSRVIRFPPSAQLRPTPDRVRETLFSWLGQRLAKRRIDPGKREQRGYESGAGRWWPRSFEHPERQ